LNIPTLIGGVPHEPNAKLLRKDLSASFFMISSTLSFTLYKYHASKEQKYFFDKEM